MQVQNGPDSAEIRRDSREKGEALVLQVDQQIPASGFQLRIDEINSATADANEGFSHANSYTWRCHQCHIFRQAFCFPFQEVWKISYFHFQAMRCVTVPSCGRHLHQINISVVIERRFQRLTARSSVFQQIFYPIRQ